MENNIKCKWDEHKNRPYKELYEYVLGLNLKEALCLMGLVNYRLEHSRELYIYQYGILKDVRPY